MSLCWADVTPDEIRIVFTAGGFEESLQCDDEPDARCSLGLCAMHCAEIHVERRTNARVRVGT